MSNASETNKVVRVSGWVSVTQQVEFTMWVPKEFDTANGDLTKRMRYQMEELAAEAMAGTDSFDDLDFDCDDIEEVTA